MKFKIDNLQYCKWSREIFEINRNAGLDAVHVTIVYHEDYDELLNETNISPEKINLQSSLRKQKSGLNLIREKEDKQTDENNSRNASYYD